MKLRSLVLAVVLLAVLAGVVALVNRPPAPPPADARVGQPLASTAAVDQAMGFRLADTGKTVELKKSAAGGWLVASYYDFPADVAKLSRFAGELTEARLDRLVTTSPARLARLGFADTRVQLLAAAGQPILDLVLGKNADTGGGRFVRYGTEDKAYLATLSTFLDLDSKNWADSTLLTLKPDEIAKFELTFPATDNVGGASSSRPDATTVVAARAKKDDSFTAESAPAGQRLKATSLATILGNLSSLHFDDTAALDDPNAIAAKTVARTVRLTTYDGKTITVAVGRKPEEKKPKAPAPKPDPAKTPDSPASATAAAVPPSTPSADKPADPAKPAEPEFDITPAGPVFVTITHSDPASPINALMAKRAFQIADYLLTALPATPADLFEPVPAPSPSAAPAVIPAILPSADATPAKAPDSTAPAK